MTDLVTGGAGFIGRHLVDVLRARGERVRVLDIDPGEGWPGEVEIVRGSITDPDAVHHAMRGVRRVFHLAAISDLWVSPKSAFGRVNLGGTQTVLAEVARARPERVVCTSSEVVFVGRHTQRNRDAEIDEDVALPAEDMLGPYCRSKRLAELAALEAAGAGLPVLVVNPTLPLGPGDRRLTPPTRMVRDFLNRRHPAYLDWTLNLVDARDAALGHVLAAERGRVGERYILGGANLRMPELLALLEDISGVPMPRRRVPYWLAWASAVASELIADHLTRRPPVAPLTGVRLAGRAAPLSSAKARSRLSWSCRPVRAMLAECIAWLAEAGHIAPRAARGSAGKAT